jgi:homoserine O-succinyltransferase
MALFFDRTPAREDKAEGPWSPGRTPQLEFRESDAGCIDIGLVNNMPDAALEATERQFSALLESAAEGLTVRLTPYALPEVPRSEPGRVHIASYASLGDLWNRRVDALIVTGTEPRAQNLKDEPYWEPMTRLLDWADRNTHSSIWSCLAAHAAVLHMDGIGRRLLSDKRFGVFACDRLSGNQMTAGVPSLLPMPHSRWNDLPEDALVGCGYRVLTRSKAAGVDSFVKQSRSLFLFFQGHPEYEAITLMLEYRRDVGRYLRGERETYPPLPHDYFDRDTVKALKALQERGVADRREEVLTDFPAGLASKRVAATWRATAVRIYRNWLLHTCAQKERRLRERAGRQQHSRTRPLAPGVAAAKR